MRIKTALYNTDHLEYGIVTIPFPIPKDQYDSTIKMLEAFDIGDPRERDCMVREVLGPVPSLKCLEGTQINVDELDYLVKRLDSFSDDEIAQFQAMAFKLGKLNMTGLITVTVTDKDGNKVEQEETYTVAVPITDLETIWSNVSAETGLTISAEQKRNADSIYNLVLYGSSTGMEGWIPGADVPYIGADGFCSPIGSGWQSRVTSEFGYRKDPFTGETRGHTGMDLSVPTGTPVRAALSGTVTVSQYNSSYGYYVVVDHGNGLSTLYAHNSKLLVRVGQTVEAGDIVSLSGSTGRSTGPHLHFEVRVNGERTNPRYYLPT